MALLLVFFALDFNAVKRKECCVNLPNLLIFSFNLKQGKKIGWFIFFLYYFLFGYDVFYQVTQKNFRYFQASFSFITLVFFYVIGNNNIFENTGKAEVSM